MARPGRDTGTAHRLKAYMLRDRGLSNSAIGRVLDVSHQAVGGWFKSGRAEAEYRHRCEAGGLPDLTPSEAAAADAEQSSPRRARSMEPEHGVRVEAAQAGASVLKLHRGGHQSVGPLVSAEMATAYAEAAGYAVALWRALVAAGVAYHEAVEWAGRVAAGDDDAQALRTLYERAKAAGIVRLARAIWDGEGAPATAWQVLQRIAPEYAAPADAEGDVDLFDGESVEDLTRGLDDAVAALTA
jgi:hypothetical protein